MYQDYYYADNATDCDEIDERVDHCLESLHLGSLCAADLNLWTFRWTPHIHIKSGNHIPQQHECVDWVSLHAWMRERAIGWGEVVLLMVACKQISSLHV